MYPTQQNQRSGHSIQDNNLFQNPTQLTNGFPNYGTGNKLANSGYSYGNLQGNINQNFELFPNSFNEVSELNNSPSIPSYRGNTISSDFSNNIMNGDSFTLNSSGIDPNYPNLFQNIHNSRNNNDDKKKKRVRRACIQCRKSHLKCDGTRPCERCIKKNLNCEDELDIEKKEGYIQIQTKDGRHVFVKENQVENETDLALNSENDTDNSQKSYSNNLEVLNSDIGDEFNNDLIGDDLNEGKLPILERYLSENVFLKSELHNLKETAFQQNQLLSLLMQQIQNQTLELNTLKEELQKSSGLIRVRNEALKDLSKNLVGPFDNFGSSTTHGVMVFENTISKEDSLLLAFNNAACHFFNLEKEYVLNFPISWMTLGK